MKGQNNREQKDIYHLLPDQDIKEHAENENCPCNPTRGEFDGGILITHNAFDGRELHEKGQEDITNNLN